MTLNEIDIILSVCGLFALFFILIEYLNKEQK